MPKTLSQELGQWGEEMAAKYLKGKGYAVLDRNFRRKWGEIDLICSISPNVLRGTLDNKLDMKKINSSINVPRGTFMSKIKSLFKANKNKTIQNRNNSDKIVFIEVKTTQSKSLRPEENVTPAKQKRLIRSCQLYLSASNYSVDTDWQIDVIGILLDKNTGQAKIEHVEQAVYFN